MVIQELEVDVCSDRDMTDLSSRVHTLVHKIDNKSLIVEMSYSEVSRLLETYTESGVALRVSVDSKRVPWLRSHVYPSGIASVENTHNVVLPKVDTHWTAYTYSLCGRKGVSLLGLLKEIVASDPFSKEKVLWFRVSGTGGDTLLICPMEKQPFGALASLFEDEPVPVREESTTASAPPCETQQDSSLKDGVSVGEEEKLPALGIQGGMRFLADCSTGNTPLLADTVRMGMAETLYAYLGRFLPKVYPNEVSHLVESGMVFDLLFGIVSSPEDNGGDHLFPMFTASTLVLKDKRLCKYIFQGSGKDDVRLCLKTRVHGLREQLVKLNLCQMNPYQGVYLYGGSRKNTLLLVLVTVDGARRGENEMNEGVRREAVFDRNARDLRKVQSVLSTAVGGAKSVLPRHAAVVLCGE